MSKIFDLWNTVAGAFGPSGREDAVRETIAEIAGAYIDDVTTDALGNLICRKKGAKNGKKLLFAAHMDSIGVVATYIEDKGFIRFSQIGGLYVGDLLNIQVKFANGTRGVISYEEKTPLKDLTLDNLFIDIGAKNAEEARKLVQIGDFAVYEAPRFEQNGVLCGPYLDNRIGCVTLLLMMEQLADKEIIHSTSIQRIFSPYKYSLFQLLLQFLKTLRCTLQTFDNISYKHSSGLIFFFVLAKTSDFCINTAFTLATIYAYIIYTSLLSVYSKKKVLSTAKRIN